MLGGACVEDAGSHGQGFSSDVTCSSSREMCYLGDMSGAEAQESTSAALAALEAEVSRMQVRGVSGHSCRHVVYECACLGRGAFYREPQKTDARDPGTILEKEGSIRFSPPPSLSLLDPFFPSADVDNERQVRERVEDFFSPLFFPLT